MAVSYDAVSQPVTHSSSGGSFSWSHVPSGTPRGVVVFTFVNANSDDVTSVTYGGSSLSTGAAGAWRANNNNATFACDCKAWFLGSSIPTGSQTVVVNKGGSNNIFAIAMTFTAAANTEVYDAGVVKYSADGTTVIAADVTDGSPGTNSLRVAGINMGISGWNEPIKYGASNVVLADTTAGQTSVWADGTANNLTSIGVNGIYDYGNRGVGVVRETANGQGTRKVGFTATYSIVPAANTGIAAVHLAVREVTGGGGAAGDPRILLPGTGQNVPVINTGAQAGLANRVFRIL